MELQEIRIAWLIGLAVLWGVVLLIGVALAALGRAIDHAREVIAASKQEAAPRAAAARAGDTAVVHAPQAAGRLRC
jgi:hypothetical protein